MNATMIFTALLKIRVNPTSCRFVNRPIYISVLQMEQNRFGQKRIMNY